MGEFANKCAAAFESGAKAVALTSIALVVLASIVAVFNKEREWQNLPLAEKQAIEAIRSYNKDVLGSASVGDIVKDGKGRVHLLTGRRESNLFHNSFYGIDVLPRLSREKWTIYKYGTPEWDTAAVRFVKQKVSENKM